MKSSLKLSFIVFLCGFFISTLLAIYFSSPLSWLVWLSTTLGMLAAKDAKDGKWTNFLFDIISYLTYIIVCIKENYYGELILSFIVIVINIFSIIEWKKHSFGKEVLINKITLNETHFAMFVWAIIFIIYAIFLNIFNSSMPILNALGTTFFLLGNYFSYRRCGYQFYCWGIYEITFIILWLVSAINSNAGNIIFLIDGIVELIYNIMGIFTWNKLSKLQNQKIFSLTKHHYYCAIKY